MKPHLTIAILAVIILIAGAMGVVFVLPSFLAQAQTAVAEYEMSGWAWTENYGWISLNCDNRDTCGDVQYEVVTDGENVTGWGWSSNVGWICFGTTCQGYVPDAGDLKIVEGSNSNNTPDRFEGDAGVVSLGNDGIIRLGYSTMGVSSIYPGTRGEQCYDCKPKCETFSPPDAEGKTTCIGYYEDRFDSCATCFTNTCVGLDTELESDSQCPVGNQKPLAAIDPVSGGSGYVCSGATECVLQDIGSGVERVFCSNVDINKCQQYGLRVRNSDGGILGWGWNGNTDGVTGAGWVKFHGGGAGIVFPWLETRYGSIYTNPDRGVRQRTGVTHTNATYCIFADANSVVNISSANCDDDVISAVNLAFPLADDDSPVYRNALGKIDVTGLETVDANNFNKYNQQVEIIDEVGDIDGPLGGKVYVSATSLTISSNLSLANGGDGERGNGTIIVKGDLIVNDNISYSGGSVDDTRQLASVAWIVEGDVIVAPNVEKVVGAFVVLGTKGAACTIGEGGDYPKYNKTNCGIFFSDEGPKGLDVLGVVIAKAFDLRRYLSEASRGSERIIYDGRLIANPPPGFKGFIEGLPVIRDFSF